MKAVRILCLAVLYTVLSSALSAQINYSTQVQPIFDTHCAGCHVPARSGWNVSSYSTVMASVGAQYGIHIVLPGNSTGSPLYDKIASATPLHGLRMPRAGGYLSDADIATIKQWIDEGATEVTATAVSRSTDGVPEQFSLSQNYPNPFNPVTHISFALPVAQYVRLTIFDVVGREVSVPVNGTLQAGSYSIEWNGANAGSGLYFYQLRTAGSAAGGTATFVSTKKFILQK